MAGLDLTNVFSSERHYGEFKCHLCDQLASLDSYITKGCSHVFCKECCHSIDTFMTKCPRCRVKIQGLGDLQILKDANPLGYRILGKVRVACPHRHEGCDWVGDYEKYADHLESKHHAANNNLESGAVADRMMMRRNDLSKESNSGGSRKSSTPPRRISNEQRKQSWTPPRRISNEQRKQSWTPPPPSEQFRYKKEKQAPVLPSTAGGAMRRKSDKLSQQEAVRISRSLCDVQKSRNLKPSSSKLSTKENEVFHRGRRRSTTNLQPSLPSKHLQWQSSFSKKKDKANRKSSLSTSAHNMKKNRSRKSSLSTSGHSTKNVTSTALPQPSRRGSLVSALAIKEEVPELMSEETKYAITCAESHYYNREYENCISLCNDALELDDKTSMAYQHKGRSQIELGLFDAAVETFTNAAEKIPKSDKVQQYLSHATQLMLTMKRVANLEASGDYLEVIKVTDRAVGANKHVLLARARAFVHLNDHQLAIQEATSVISIDTQNLDALLVRSRAFYLNGNIDHALLDCQAAVNFDMTNRASMSMHKLLQLVADLFRKISNLMEANKYEEAIEEYSTLNKVVKPTIPDCKCELFRTIYRGRARTRLEEGKDYNLALLDLMQVLETAPRDIDSWLMKVTCLERLDRHHDLANELSEIVITWGSSIPELAEANNCALKRIEQMPEGPLIKDSKTKDKTKDNKARDGSSSNNNLLKKNPFKRKQKYGPVMTPDMAASPELLGDILTSKENNQS